MKRYDLRKHKENFLPRMVELMKTKIKDGENGIFLFEIGDFSPIQKSFDTMKNAGHEVKNSLKFNEFDWTLVVKRKAS